MRPEAHDKASTPGGGVGEPTPDSPALYPDRHAVGVWVTAGHIFRFQFCIRESLRTSHYNDSAIRMSLTEDADNL